MSTSPRFVARLLAAAALATSVTLSSASAQTATATTDPVGFITLSVSGNGGTGTALSFKSLGMARQVEYQGNAEDILADNRTLLDSDSNWDDQQFNPTATDAYYLEITGPTGAAGIGTTYDILSTDAANQRLTIAANQSFATAGVTDGATFRIRKHWTIAAAFGANNEGGLTAGTSTTADIIRVYDAQGSFTGYYYSNVTGDVGWRRVNGVGDQANVIIYPEDGLVIAKSNGTAANVVLMGAVKTGQTSFPVVSGLNVVANPYAAPMTLGSSGLYTGNPSTGVKAGGPSNADRISIYNGTGYDVYFYSSGGLFGQGWRKAGGGTADMGQVQIPVGASILIERAGNTGFNWVAPQHPASL